MNWALWGLLITDFLLGFSTSCLVWALRIRRKTRGLFAVDRTGNNGRTVIRIEVEEDPEHFNEGDYLRVKFLDGELGSKFNDELWSGESEES